MPKPLLFVSDIHIQHDDDKAAKAFRAFLDEKASKAQALYLLGDIFDAWLGDDQLSTFPKTIAALEQASSQTQVYFMHGNHDFLLGKVAFTKCHMKCIQDPTLIHHFDQNILITHGDLLCVNDLGYQRFRKVIQHPLTQFIFLMMPFHWRQRFAQKLKKNSQQQTAKKEETRMDACDTVAQQWLAQHQANIMIHGHTHKPGKHHYANDLFRYVLGAWHDQLNALQLDPHGAITFLTF